MEQKYRAVKNYQINIDYDIDKLIRIATSEPKYKDEIIDGFDDFDDFKKNAVLMGIRTTLENELKISDTEALNYLMGFPLNFKLESLVKLLFDILPNKIDRRLVPFGDDYIEKNKFLALKETLEEETDSGHVARLRLNFNKKKKLIEQNFKSTTHIDVQEFLAWSESRGFIKNKFKARTAPVSGA